MVRKKLGSSEPETPQISRPPETSDQKTAASGAGGRPVATSKPLFLVTHALRLYVDFLQSVAPSEWSKRQLNFELFDKQSPNQMLTSDINATDGLGALLDRSSLPVLIDGQKVSGGIKAAEKKDRFRGGLQILYHPYLLMLAGPRELSEIRKLLAFCRQSQRLGLFKYAGPCAYRTRKTVEVEIETFAKYVGKTRRKPLAWKAEFLGLVCIAIGLTLEAEALGDRHALNCWKRWLKKRSLRFKSWPIGNIEDRERLDKSMQLLVENCEVVPINVFHEATHYLTSHVLQTESVDIHPADPKAGSLEDTRMTPKELAELFLSLIDGKQPEKADLDWIFQTMYGTTAPP